MLFIVPIFIIHRSALKCTVLDLSTLHANVFGYTRFALAFNEKSSILSSKVLIKSEKKINRRITDIDKASPFKLHICS